MHRFGNAAGWALLICSAGLACASARAQEPASTSPPPARSVPLVIPQGLPLRVVLEKRLPIKREGQPVEGRLVEPLYAFDREVVPAGSKVIGRIARIEPVTRARRLECFLNANFTPAHKVEVQFDALELRDGTHVPVRTDVTLGTASTMRLVSTAGKDAAKKNPAAEAAQRARQQVAEAWHRTKYELKAPGKLQRLKAMALAQLPVHSQAFPAGTVFNAELLAPLGFGAAEISAQELGGLGGTPGAGSLVRAFLVTPLNSATTKQGAAVEALISQPVFSTDRHLILPAGSRLQGQVLQARPARRLHRNGQLRITLQRIDLPEGDIEHEAASPAREPQNVDASLEGLEVDRAAHLKLDAEGGTTATDSKRRYASVAIAIALAASELNPDHEHHDAGAANGDPGNQAAAGGVGYGLLGVIFGLASRSAASAFGIYGASASFYNHFLSYGSNVVFPMDTPMEVGFGTHSGAAQKPAKTPPPSPAPSPAPPAPSAAPAPAGSG